MSRLRKEGNDLFRAGRYLAAIQIYHDGAEQARARNDPRSELRFLNNLGGAEYLVFRYRDATKSYLRARDLASSQRDLQTLGAVCNNLSSLYERMGDLDAALTAAREAAALPADSIRPFRVQFLMQMARIRVRRQEWDAAASLQRAAIADAQARLDAASEAQGWNELGSTLLEMGRLPEAEFALLQGYRLRLLRRDGRIQYSYKMLGRLKLQQGDLAGAEALFNRALEEARPMGPPAMWSSYYERSRARLAQSRVWEAYQDLVNALRYLERWRVEVLPADAFRVSSEGELHQIYSMFIEVAARLYRETGKPEFAEEALAASERNRAASLRALWAGADLSQKLPPEYGETLAYLRKAEAALLKDDSAAPMADVSRLRLRLSEMETRAGLDLPRPGPQEFAGRRLLQRVRERLRPGEVFLAFHTGERESFIWVITRDRFQFQPVPGRKSLAQSVERFVTAIRQYRPSAVAGAALYHDLFGLVDPDSLDRPEWIIAPDGPLFELPFAALREREDGTYVVERHAIREVPGIAAMSAVAVRLLGGRFVGVGDPIYNRADSRLGQAGNQTPTSLEEGTELARLPGSGREVENCARIWRARGRDTLVLKGQDANRQNLLTAMRNNAAVVHLATHILFPANSAGPGMLALGKGGLVDLLNASEISGLSLNLGLVVLDGCSSGQGAILPGTGLMGLTRAWLAAGARAVMATRWPAADQDAGELFQAFYENLSVSDSAEPVSFSRVLQQAQIVQLRAGGAAANPAKWASYFCVERN